MSDEYEEKPKSNKGVIITGIIASIIIIIAVISLIAPVEIIGIIWDWDIETQLKNQNAKSLELDRDKSYYRLIYDNNESTDMRIERAVKVYEKMFADPENTHDIIKTENTTLLEFIWVVEKQK